MSRRKRKNKGPRSGKLHKALCEKDVNGGGRLPYYIFVINFQAELRVVSSCDLLHDG